MNANIIILKLLLLLLGFFSSTNLTLFDLRKPSRINKTSQQQSAPNKEFMICFSPHFLLQVFGYTGMPSNVNASGLASIERR